MDDQLSQSLVPEVPEGIVGLSAGSAQPLDFEIVKKFTSISVRMLERVAAYLQLVWSIRAEKEGKKDFSEGITSIRDVLCNIKYKFHDEYKYKNIFWLRDCAGSLRAIILDLNPADLHRTFKNIDIQIESPRLSCISEICCFLSEISHFRLKSAQNKINRILTQEEMVGTSDYNDSNFKKNFEVICIKLIYLLHSIFEDYCYEKNN